MPQKARGAAQLMTRIYALIDRVRANTKRGAEYAIYNPPLAKKMHQENDALMDELAELLEAEVEPRMERAAPPLERRVAELEARIEALEQTAPIRLVHAPAPIRKEGT